MLDRMANRVRSLTRTQRKEQIVNATQGFFSALSVAAVVYATPAGAQQSAGVAAGPAAGQAATSDADAPAAAAAADKTAQPAPDEKKAEPFAFADFTWLTGNPRTKESPINTNVFTGEFRVDTNFT